MFITFEGGDGAGKSTLIDRLVEKLATHGREVVKTREPGGTPLGEKIREWLLSTDVSPQTELFLFLAARAQHVDEQIKPALAEHKIVLCDRFNDSTIAYQGRARGLGEKKVHEACQLACNGLTPNLTLYLDIDPMLGLQRATGEKDRIESETLEFHQQVRNSFHLIAKQEPQRFHIIDATQSKEAVLDEAMALIREKGALDV